MAGQTLYSGGGYYVDNFSTTSGQTLAQRYMFNSTNKVNSGVNYNGYSMLVLSVNAIASQPDSTTADSMTVVMYMLDSKGHRTAHDDSVILADNITLTEGDTIDFRLDNRAIYSTHYGVAMRYTRITEATTDSIDLIHAVIFN